MSAVVTRLVNSYATLVMAGKREITEVPEAYTIGGQVYNLRELVEIEIAERTVALVPAA